MAFNKIQPQQLQLPTFFSDSGNLVFTNNSTGMTVELNANITGPVDFNDGLTIENGKNLVTSSAGTTTNGTGNAAVGNSGSLTLDGMYNVVVGGTTTSTNGEHNIVVNNHGLTFGSNTDSNTVIGGNTVTINSNITGSVGLFSNSFTETFDQNNTVYIGGQSGVRFVSSGIFEDEVYFDSDTYAKNDVTVSGALHVSGEARLTGVLNVGGRAYLDSLFVENVATFGELGEFEVGFNTRDVAYFDSRLETKSGITASGQSIFEGTTYFSGETILSGNNRKVISGSSLEIYGDLAFDGGDFTISGSTIVSTDYVGDFVTGGGLNSFIRNYGASSTTPPTDDGNSHWAALESLGGGINGIRNKYIDLHVSGHRFRVFGVWNPS